MAKSPSTDATLVRSARRTLDILSWFSLEHPQGRISEIAKDLDLAPSTVRRLVTALAECGYLQLDEATSRYSLHIEVVRLAAVAVSTNDVVRSAEPMLDRLLKELDETIVLNVLSGTLVVHLASRQSVHRFSIYPPQGRRYQAYEGGASGIVLLAWLDSDELDAILPDVSSWPSYGHNQILKRTEFLDALKMARVNGWAVNDGRTDPDLWSVAAPIRDHTGRVVAALSAACRRSFMTDERRESLPRTVLQAASEISLGLRFHGQSQPLVDLSLNS
ncbi:MAG TPA: IclR family transcriptional regulator [Acidimicrobiales bacterium]|nr:IclR family transcriptional regulator [Acidimicrobiales bacterium]